MSSFPILDLVVGMIFIYFLLSIISSSAVEMIMTARKVRSKILAEWLYNIFDKTITQPDGTKLKLGQAIMDHCSVTALAKAGVSPSYIDAKNFTSALLEKITFDPKKPKSIATDLDSFIAKIENTDMLSTEFQRVLLNYAHEARDNYQSVSVKTVGELDLFRKKIEIWYDSSMDRISGKMKTTYCRPFTILVACITAIFLNADSITIAKYLYSNPDARAKIAAQGYSAGKDSISSLQKRVNALKASPEVVASMNEVTDEMKMGLQNINESKASLQDNIPLGWNGNPFINARGKVSLALIISKLAGLAATILAIIMGAPFWFDMLNKISNLRSAGPKPESTADDDKAK